METTFKNIGLLFIGILLIVIWSFYHTFFKLFVSFNSSNIAQHLDMIVFLFWFAALIAQPILISYKKFVVHKAFKRLVYMLAPLVMFAMYFVAKEQYLQDIDHMAKSEAIARQTLGLPNIFAFAILYILAILNKDDAFNNMRYFIACTLLLISVGLSHLFIVYIHFPFSMGVALSVVITNLVLLTLMVNDKIYGHTIKPYLAALVIVLTTHLVCFCVQNTIVWQNVAGKFAQVFYW